MSAEEHNIEDEEVKKLLQTKLDNVEDLDLLDDEELGSLNEETSEEDLELIKAITDIPPGEEGMKQLLNSPAVTRIEEQLDKPFDDQPKGRALTELLTQLKVEDRTEEYKNNVEQAYVNAMKSVQQLYRKISKGCVFSNSKIRNIVNSFMNVFIKDRCIVLNLSGYHIQTNDYLFEHALHVCLQAMNIATACKYSQDQVIEIGSAGLMADVGMMLIPESIRQKKGKLNKDEFFEIQKHPMLGIAVLEKVMGMPDTVAYTSYQHHERCSGIGYPKLRGSRIIHNYAKIVSIADVYQALSTDRAHRSGLQPDKAIVMLLKMAHAGMLDKEIVKQFVRSISVYPVGSLVELTDGRKAKVIQANQDNVKEPMVSLIADSQGKKLKKEDVNQIDLANSSSVKISRGISSAGQEISLMEGF
ncbi:MAG: HD domain-containing protein [Fibrobacteria bacterium]|nr:HD domain-containing protein [Fibrobacteria bacterium]